MTNKQKSEAIEFLKKNPNVTSEQLRRTAEKVRIRLMHPELFNLPAWTLDELDALFKTIQTLELSAHLIDIDEFII